LVLYCHQDAQAKETCQIITIETTEGVEAIDEIATIEITTGAAADQEGRGQDQDRGQDLRATIIPVAFHQLA
jgi:2-keto-3-deoxy-L-rhamnonate aldolase RhmA